MRKYIPLFLLLFFGVCHTLPASAFGDPFLQWKVITGTTVYDGKKVTSKEAPGGIPSAMCEDADGNVWVAFSGKGVRMWNGQSLVDPKAPKESLVNAAEILCMAAGDKGTLWIGTSEGLVKKEGTTWTNLPADVTGLQAVRDIAVTPTGKVYLSGLTSDGKRFTGGAIAFYNGSGFAQFNAGNSTIPDMMLQNLTLDANGHLWMTLGNNDLGLAKFDGKNWKLFNTNTGGLPTNDIGAIAATSAGKIIVATATALLEYNGTDFTTRPYSNGFGPTLTTAMTAGKLVPQSLMIEKNGDLWIGFKDKGVYSYHPYGDRFYSVENALLPSNEVLQIIKSKSGQKWFRTGTGNANWHLSYFEKIHSPYLYSSGIAAFAEHGKMADPKWTVYNNLSFNKAIGMPYNATVNPADGGVLLSTTDGLAAMKGDKITSLGHYENESYYNVYAPAANKVYLMNTFKVRQYDGSSITPFAKVPNLGGISFMTTDAGGTLWGGGSGGVSRWTGTDWETFNKKNGLPSIIVYALFKDSKGTLWAGTQKGLAKWDGNAFVEITTEFPSESIRSIAEDPKGRLWVGSGKGLSILEGDSWTHFSKLTTPKVNKFAAKDIVFDKEGNGWVGTEYDGLLRFDGKDNWTQYNFDNTGALANNIYSLSAGSDGTLYVVSNFYEFQSRTFTTPFGTITDPDEMLLQNYTKRRITNDPSHYFTIIRP